MARRTRFLVRGRSSRAGLVLATGAAVALTSFSPARASSLVLPQLPALTPGAAVFVRPATTSFTITGRGWGHAIGMSQVGAQGAAKAGIGAAAILAHYYPHTTTVTVAKPTIRVWIQQAARVLTVTATPGLRLSIPGKTPIVLPSGPVAWRLTASSSTGAVTLTKLPSRTSAWAFATLGSGTTAVGPSFPAGTSFTPAAAGTAGTPVVRGLGGVRVEFTSGNTATYPGNLTVVRPVLTDTYAVVVLTAAMDDYLRSVVPQEMGAGSPAAALQAQAVAARTYAARSAYDAARNGRKYDICNTSSCQAFPGIATGTVSGGLSGDVARIYSGSDSAVAATAGQELYYSGAPIFAMFSAANGGYTRSGGTAYLPVQADPWDALTGSSSHAWSATLPLSVLEAHWPGLGSLQRVQIVGRDGLGDLGGRATTVLLDFCTSTVCTEVSSTPAGVASLYSWPGSATGLRSSWWLPTNGLTTVPVAAAITPTAPRTLLPGQASKVSAGVKFNGTALAGVTATLQVLPVDAPVGTVWKTVGAAVTSSTGAVSIALPGQSADFKWRLSVPGDGYTRLTSAVIGATGIAVASTATLGTSGAVAYMAPGSLNGTVTFKGKAVVAQLTVSVAPLGTTTWTTVATPTTSSTGAFAVSLPGRATSYSWRIYVPGDGYTRLPVSFTGAIGVHLSVSVHAVSATVAAGARPVIAGTALPARAGSTVSLYRWTGTAWLLQSTGLTDATGAFQLAAAPLASGSAAYRVSVTPPAGAPNLPIISATVSVKAG